MFLFLPETQFIGYADDNTPFVVRDNIPDVISALSEIGEKLSIWFSNMQMPPSVEHAWPELSENWKL